MMAKAERKEAEDEEKAAEYKSLTAVRKAQWGSDVAEDLQLDEAKLRAAMEKEEARLARADEGDRKVGPDHAPQPSSAVPPAGPTDSLIVDALAGLAAFCLVVRRPG